jgi:hypothetical protein
MLGDVAEGFEIEVVPEVRYRIAVGLITTLRRMSRPEGPRKMIIDVRHRGDRNGSPPIHGANVGRARIPARHEVTRIGSAVAIPARRETGPPGRVHSPMTSEKLGGTSYLARCPVRWGVRKGALCAQ